MLLKKNPNFDFIETDENGLAIFNPMPGDTCIVDDIGVSLFHAIGEGATMEVILQTLSQEYDAPLAEIQQDVEEFVDQLKEQGILLCE